MLRIGVLAATAAYCLWGILPLILKLLAACPPPLVLAIRTLMCFALALALLLLGRKVPALKDAWRSKKTRVRLLLAGCVIFLNWLLYIVAVNGGNVLDASMGYYMNPLVMALFSTLLFKEKLSRLSWVSVALAVCGVTLMVIQYGRFPVAAVSIAISFAVYGCLKKGLSLPPVVSLVMETSVTIPISLVIVIYYEAMGRGLVATGAPMDWLSVLIVGLGTLAPLMLFAFALNRLPFSMVGFFQYISPCITLCLGLFLYHEELTPDRLTAFAWIWAALLIFIIDTIRVLVKAKPAVLAPPAAGDGDAENASDSSAAITAESGGDGVCDHSPMEKS